MNQLQNSENNSNAGKSSGNGASSNKAQLKCSMCGKIYDREQSKLVPFCSRRCQQVDLGRWLGEDYGFPIERSDDGFGMVDTDENE